MQSPKSAVFTTVRAHDGRMLHLDLHLARLTRHAEILGIEVPEFEIPEDLHGLVRIQVENDEVSFDVSPFYQEPHSVIEGITVAAPRWTRKITGTKHGAWDPYREITTQVFEKGADVALLVHEFCIVDGDRAMPLVLDEDGTVWISSPEMGGVDSVSFLACKSAIEAAGFVIHEGRLNERLVARAKEVVMLGTGMGAARLEVLDDVDIGDGSNTLQMICKAALKEEWD